VTHDFGAWRPTLAGMKTGPEIMKTSPTAT